MRVARAVRLIPAPVSGMDTGIAQCEPRDVSQCAETWRQAGSVRGGRPVQLLSVQLKVLETVRGAVGM